jgi:hypothetical protein
MTLIAITLVLVLSADIPSEYAVFDSYTGPPSDASRLMRFLRPVPPGRVQYFARIPAVEPEDVVKARRKIAGPLWPRWCRAGWEVEVHDSEARGPILFFEVMARPRIGLVGRRESNLFVNAWC